MIVHDRQLEDYILAHIDREDPVLQQLDRETNQRIYHPRRMSGHLMGKMLEMISKMIRPQTILEIGTFTGYSAICLAKGLAPGGQLHTIEINDELEEMCTRYFADAGLKDQIQFHIGDALKLIPRLNQQFDLVFLDGNKAEYVAYYDTVMPYLKPGGYLLADNIFWDGKVLTDQPEPGDHFTRGIQDFNRKVATDDRVEKTIFPIRDGLFVIRKKDTLCP